MVQIRVRAVIGVMIFLGYFLIYIIRYNLSVHVVDMAQISKRERVKYNFTVSIRSEHNTMRSKTGLVDLINWDDLKMGKLFSAYHIGFCVCFPLFHSFGDRIGPTWVVGIAGMTSGVLSCLTPPSAYVNFWALFVVRIITGFCAGAMQPSMVQVLRHWVPPMERNYFLWAYCGITMGTCSTFLFCAAVQFYSRWPVGFYISGGLQIVWSMVWVLAVTDSPRYHPYISHEEQAYLINTIGTIFTIKLTNSEAPWKLILMSVSFWALCVLNFGYSWMIISLCIHGPLYYSKVLEHSIYNASVLTALPFFLRLVVGTIVIQLFHWYKHNSKIRRIKHIRKYFIVVSHVIPGLLVASCWLLPDVIPGPILLTIAVALTAAGMDMTLDLCYVLPAFRVSKTSRTIIPQHPRCWGQALNMTHFLSAQGLYPSTYLYEHYTCLNIMELTPTFVSSVYTVIKIIGNTAGILVSLCVGQVTQTYKNSPIVWKHIWCFHATILFLSGFVFLIWGETEVQPWNFRRVRPQRQKHFEPKVSRMSNITEVEEGSETIRISQTRTIQQH